MLNDIMTSLLDLSIQDLLTLRSYINRVIGQKVYTTKTPRQIATEENDIPEIPTGPAVEGLEIPVITKIEETK